jgi:peroxiredoxin Q/BCP
MGVAAAEVMLRVGDMAPLFTLPNQAGESIALASLIGIGPVVLFFYPSDYNPLCTLELIAFRSHYHFFNEAGAVVIGVSSNGSDSHAVLCSILRLQFHLLSDREQTVRSQYCVRRVAGLMPGRMTFVIDKTGVVRYIYTSQLRFAHHVQEAQGLSWKSRRECKEG